VRVINVSSEQVWAVSEFQCRSQQQVVLHETNRLIAGAGKLGEGGWAVFEFSVSEFLISGFQSFSISAFPPPPPLVVIKGVDPAY